MSALDAQIVSLVTRDLEATTRFYVDGLGLPLALDQGTCRIIRVAPGAFIGFCRRDATPNPDGLLVTEDVDGWFDRLRARGIAIEKAPAHHPAYRICHGFLRDPNGYLVEDPALRRSGVEGSLAVAASTVAILDMGGNRAILVGVGDLSPMKGAYSMGCGCGKKTPAAPVKKPSKPSDKK